MKRTLRLALVALTALVSLTLLFPAPLSLAQGPVGEQNKAAQPGPELFLVPEVEGGNAPNAGLPEIVLPSQGVPQGAAELSSEPLLPNAESGGNDPLAGGISPNLVPGNQPSLVPPSGNQPSVAPPTGNQPALDVRPALLGSIADQVVEQLRDWMHKEADEVSDSFNRWLHDEVDRLLASFESWLAGQLDGTDGAKTLELEPVEG
jgi:hypothetical protein